MAGLKEIELYQSARLPSKDSDQKVVNRQVIDALKHINTQIGIIHEKTRELEEKRSELFKYLKGNLSNERTTPNEKGEVLVDSDNNSIDIKSENEKVWLRVKNWGNLSVIDQELSTESNPSFAGVVLTDELDFDNSIISTYKTPGTLHGFLECEIDGAGTYWIPIYSSISP